MVLLLALACTDPDAGRGPVDTSSPDSGATSSPDSGVSDSGATSSPDPWESTGDCGVPEGPPPDDPALGEEYQAFPAYIAGTDRRFETIQGAIWGADDGDTVVVKPGTYTGTVDLVGKVITLCSEQGPAVTVLDAEGVGPVVRLRAWEPAETVVQGFTITGGVGEGDETFGPTPHGGGVFVEWGSPTIRHNVIVDNQADIAGGVYARNGAPTVEHNVIAWNHAPQGGGGFVCSACRGRFANNVVYRNTAGEGDGLEYFWGVADNTDNLYVVDAKSRGLVRFMEPRPEVEWQGGPNQLWPDVQLLVDVDDVQWPHHDTWVVADPGLAPDPSDPAWGWGEEVVDPGPYDGMWLTTP